MNIVRDVLAELFGMFLGDARLAGSILVVVAVCAALIDIAGVTPLVAGLVLLTGCLVVLVGAVLTAARRQQADRAAGSS